mgnify:CR=1 FL=1
MAIQQVQFRTITSPETLSNLNTLAMINQSASDVVVLTITGQATNITLAVGQSLELNASTGFLLPDIEISGSNINLDIVSS